MKQNDTEATHSCELHSASQCWHTDNHSNHNNNETTKSPGKCFVDDAAHLLHEQWPNGGTVMEYKCKLLGIDRQRLEIEEKASVFLIETTTIGNGSSSSSSSQHRCLSQQHQSPQLPCSYLLLDNSGRDDYGCIATGSQLVGHGRLTECFSEGSGGNAAAATYIITQPRRKGYGRILMELLEQEAMKLGYHYMYLWTTSTAVDFYYKINYTRTERISLNSACLKTLATKQVGVLESMLAKRSNRATTTNAKINVKETVTLPPDTNGMTESDVWLRKRLVESVPSILIPLSDRMDEMKSIIRRNTVYSQCRYWEYHLHHNVPWQQQIGPSCGLTALRMLYDFYFPTKEGADDDNNSNNDNSSNNMNHHTIPSSLLVEAQTKGYTTDGEIFDIKNLLKLTTFCGLNATASTTTATTSAQRFCVLQSFQSMSYTDLLRILQNGHGTVIVPYDAQPGTKLPCQNGGTNAHYGIIVGMMLGYHQQRNESSHNTDKNNCDDDDNNNSLQSSSSIVLVEMQQRPAAKDPVEAVAVPDSNEHDNDTSRKNTTPIVLLLVQHGASSKFTVASFHDFVASNSQLHATTTTTAIDTTTDTTTSKTCMPRSSFDHDRNPDITSTVVMNLSDQCIAIRLS